jgi:putative radical SAM enzyme (TIGR03279 family)
MSDQAQYIEDLNRRAIQGKPAAPIGQITAVEPRSAAAQMGIKAGDGLLAINGHPCQDVIDVQFYGAEDRLEITVQRGEEVLTLSGKRRSMQPLGLSFAHPTFDIDIRRCNNLCPFCFVLQMGPRFRRTLYIKDDDYRYSFLFGHYVTLTNLAEGDWQRILDQRLSPLYISVHATDVEKRRECLRNPTAPDIMAQLRELAQHHFEVHTQIVVTPGLNDGEHLRRSVYDLAELYPTVASVSVVPVGLTKHHKYGHHPATAEQAAQVLEAVETWQREFLERLGIRFVYCTDEYYLITGHELPALDDYDGLMLHENGLGMVRAFLDEWETVRQNELPKLRTDKQHITLATGMLAVPVIQKAAAELAAAIGIRADVLGVVNQRLGETITVAGLLMAEDVLAELKQHHLGEVVILPRIMFDHPDGVSLDDISPAKIAQEIGKPVALADWMGDVIDTLTDQNKLLFTPDAPLISPDDIMQDGGWSVEKYL